MADSQSGAGSGCYNMIRKSCADVCGERTSDCGQTRCVCDANGFLTGERMYCESSDYGNKWYLSSSSGSCIAGQNSNQVSGGDPAASESPSSTANSSAADIQCSGECDIKAGNTCGWQANTQRHCYCDANNLTGNNKDGKSYFQLDNNLQNYCIYCAWDYLACNCPYTFADGATKKTLAFGEAVCEGSGKLQNFSMVCKGGEVAGGDGCLNQDCTNSSNHLCENANNTQDCDGLDSAIIAVAEGRGHIFNSCSQEEIEQGTKYRADNGYCADSGILRDQINTLYNEGVFSSVFNNADKIKNLAQGDAKKIACSNTFQTACRNDAGDGKTYKYQCVTAGNSGCRVWNWARGAGEECLSTDPITNSKCASEKDGGDFCYKETAPTSEKCYSTSLGKYFDTGKTICGNCKDNSGVLRAGVSCICDQNENDWALNEDCGTKGCNKETGRCNGTQDCEQEPRPCSTGDDDCAELCGSDWECKASSSGSSSSGSRYVVTPESGSPDGMNGMCTKKSDSSVTEKCTLKRVNEGTPSSSNAKCKKDGAFGVYVPFTLETEGNCENKITCTVTNDFDSSTATATPSSKGSSSWSACVFPKSQKTSSEEGTKGDSSDTLSFKISCTGGGTTKTATAECPFPSADDNAFKEAEEEEKAKDEEDKKKEEEQKKQDNTAPKVTVESPKDTITTKTAELRVTTSIDATCKYLDSKDGSFGASDFDGKGMTMTGSGTSFTATLGNLTEGAAADCKYPHTIIVLCKNKKASSGAKTGAIGSGQTDFKVDLSKNTENMPKVVSAMESEKFSIANPVLKATTNRPADCEYKKGSSFAFGSGAKFDSTGSYSHNAQLNGLDNNKGEPYKYYVVCKDKETCAISPESKIEFKIDLSLDPKNAPVIANTTPETQAVANPTLSVTTDRPSICQYKKDSIFVYGDSAAKQFTNDGDYSHTAVLPAAEYPEGKYTFFVACKDKATGAAATYDKPIATTIQRGGTVCTSYTYNDWSACANNTQSRTIKTQTPSGCTNTASAILTQSCSGDGGSACTSYTYNDWSACANGQQSRTIKTQTPAGCNNTATAILAQSCSGAGVPVISNTMPNSQTTNSPTLSVNTAAAATCQYKKDSDFAYGSGTQFTTDGDKGHSVQLAGLNDGLHTYFVVCKDTASGAVNTPGVQIIFTVAAGSQTCAKLSSNDKQNDDERDAGEGDDSDSKYLWRSVEAGTRDKFKKVDWYAGYQFTPEKDGQVTQLCGYFGSGNSNKVSLYNGAYKEIARVQIAGESGWQCASISPVPVKADKRYYVIARVKDNPIYYEYKSGLLPRDGDGAVVESGIRQLASGNFGDDVKKYDYMVFGLVDVRIKFADKNTSGPEVDSASPVGSSESDAKISVATDADATCKFDREDVDYGKMKYTFGKTGAKAHEQKVCSLSDGNFTWYVRCKGAGGGTNNASTLIQFEVSD